MNVVPQYKLIGPYNYDRIIHNKKCKKYAKRQDIGHTSGKMHLILKIKICVMGVTFDYKMTFEKNILVVSRAVSQRLGILWKSCRAFHDIDHFLRDAFAVLSS